MLCRGDEALVPVAIELWVPEAGSSEGPTSVYTPKSSDPAVRVSPMQRSSAEDHVHIASDY